MPRRPFDPIEFDQRQGRRDREHWWRTKGAWWIMAGLWLVAALLLQIATWLGFYTPKDYGKKADRSRQQSQRPMK